MYSMVTTPIANIVLYTGNLLKELMLSFLTEKKYLWGDGYVYVMGYYSAH